MSVESTVLDRMHQLIAQSAELSIGNRYDQCTDPSQLAACSAWITAAHNIVHLAIPRAEAPYRIKADRIAKADHGFGIHHAVQEFSAILGALLVDANAGLLASVADQARAETFDNFLDHAKHYLEDSRKNEAGAIAGVVFEDSLRGVCRKLGIVEKDQKLDSLISTLVTRGDFTSVKAKRARVCADVRTKATHAQWDEFELDDVRATIDFTRELIDSKLS